MCKVTEENIKALQNLRNEIHLQQQTFWKRVFGGSFILVLALVAGWWQLAQKIDHFESMIESIRTEVADVEKDHAEEKAIVIGKLGLVEEKIKAREDACENNHIHEERRWQRIENYVESLHDKLEKDRERFDNFREEMAKRHAEHHGGEALH